MGPRDLLRRSVSFDVENPPPIRHLDFVFIPGATSFHFEDVTTVFPLHFDFLDADAGSRAANRLLGAAWNVTKSNLSPGLSGGGNEEHGKEERDGGWFHD